MHGMATEQKKLENGRKRGRKPAVFMIEGESVTYPEIAERTGLSEGAVRKRMARERAKGAVTWAGIATREYNRK